MDFDKGIKTALFLGKMGILIFSFYFLSFWVYELTGSPSSLLMIGILFSGFLVVNIFIVHCYIYLTHKGIKMKNQYIML